jgi:hypothetical protein
VLLLVFLAVVGVPVLVSSLRGRNRTPGAS